METTEYSRAMPTQSTPLHSTALRTRSGNRNSFDRRDRRPFGGMPNADAAGRTADAEADMKDASPTPPSGFIDCAAALACFRGRRLRSYVNSYTTTRRSSRRQQHTRWILGASEDAAPAAFDGDRGDIDVAAASSVAASVVAPAAGGMPTGDVRPESAAAGGALGDAMERVLVPRADRMRRSSGSAAGESRGSTDVGRGLSAGRGPGARFDPLGDAAADADGVTDPLPTGCCCCCFARCRWCRTSSDVSVIETVNAETSTAISRSRLKSSLDRTTRRRWLSTKSSGSSSEWYTLFTLCFLPVEALSSRLVWICPELSRLILSFCTVPLSKPT
mmetsp:Transcript_52466/g.161527  ORF Transcript_52466/g.161527 Transcript_52466/m.161527 type:complete len:332 (-) Transcript_52466:141-1136(-)